MDSNRSIEHNAHTDSSVHLGPLTGIRIQRAGLVCYVEVFLESQNLAVDAQSRASLEVHQLHHHLRIQGEKTLTIHLLEEKEEREKERGRERGRKGGKKGIRERKGGREGGRYR